MPEYREPHSKDGTEQRSESGGSLWGTLFTLAAIPVGWYASVVAALVVFTYLISPDEPTLIAGVGPQTTFWLAVGVLVVIAFISIVIPSTVFFGWLLMGILVAVAASFFIGWSTLLLMFEGLTVVFLIFAGFWMVIEDSPDGLLPALALGRSR